jgi:hypothetical protein
MLHPHTIVSMLINDLADIDNEVFLFLDDYHSVTDPAIRGAVSFLLRYAPSHLHLALTMHWSHRYRLADCLPRTAASRRPGARQCRGIMWLTYGLYLLRHNADIQSRPLQPRVLTPVAG